MLRTRGVGWVGWGGMLSNANVHVKLQKQLMLRTGGVGSGGDEVGC